jgi:hypothetical protein
MEARDRHSRNDGAWDYRHPAKIHGNQAALGPASTCGLTQGKTMVLPLPYGSFLGKPPLADPYPSL